MAPGNSLETDGNPRTAANYTRPEIWRQVLVVWFKILFSNSVSSLLFHFGAGKWKGLILSQMVGGTHLQET